MIRAKETSLIIIAAVLVTQFFLSHLWPTVYFQSTHQDFYESVVACLKAKESFQKTKVFHDNSESHLRHKLILASKIELSSCNDYELFENKLISNGVDQYKLRVVYLEALKHKDLSLSSLVSPYEK